MNNIFLQISIILCLTVSLAFIMRMLKQPLIVAYIVAGMIVGPLFLNLVAGGAEMFEAFANFGIVLLLFIVGLSLNLGYIKKMGKAVLISSLGHFSISLVAGFILIKVMGFPFLSSLFLAISIGFSSTIIVTKLLADKKDLEAVYGRYVTGVLLLQDLIAVSIMIFLNTTHKNDLPWFTNLFITGGKGLLLIGLVYIMSKYLLPRLMDRVARSGEMLFIFTIAWCFGVASLVYYIGFSIEIGAIIAGLSLGSSIYQGEISSRIKPLRDFFIVLFFIVLGSELQLDDVWCSMKPALILSLFVLIFEPLVLYFIMRKLKYTRRNSFLASLTCTQVSEFGFILIFKAGDIGYLHGTELAIFTITALTTIVISSYLITYNEQIYQKIRPLLFRFGEDEALPDSDEVKNYDVWVFGYHRIGWKICESLSQMKINYGVVDFNPTAITKLRRRGIPCFFGDAADIEFLESLSLDKAKLIIMTIPEPDDQKILINYVRRINEKTMIVANLNHTDYLEDLYEAGANYVMLPHLLGGHWMSEVLRNYSWTRQTFRKLKEEQKEEMKLRFTMGTHL